MKRRLFRFLFYTIGLMMLTFGISLTIIAGLGTSPFDAVLVGMSERVGLTPGSWEFLIGLAMVLANALVLRKKPNVLAMFTAFVTGVGIDFWLFVGSEAWEPNGTVAQYVMFFLAVFIVGLGISTYLQAKFAPMPLDESMLMLQTVFGMKLSVAKFSLSALFLLLAFAVKGPIGIGTVIIVALSGPVIGAFYPPMEKLSQKMGIGSAPRLSTVGD